MPKFVIVCPVLVEAAVNLKAVMVGVVAGDDGRSPQSL
jgi:hypothetical protein